MTCAVDTCDRSDVIARGWCKKHYTRWQKHGDPEAAVRFYNDDWGRLFAYIDASGDCWDWTGGKWSKGYGSISVGRSKIAAHRWVWEMLVGPIPDALELDHLCRNRGCVNPDHLELVTHAENVRRGFSVATVNRLKTHCPQGHPYDAENTYFYKGWRRCRRCGSERTR